MPHLPLYPHPEPKGQLRFSSVSQSSQLFATPSTAARQASLSITSSQSLLKLMSIESVMPCNHLILCRPLLLPPSIFPSIRVFQWVSSLHQVAKVLELQLQHQSFQWIFRTDFLKDGLVWSPCSPRDSQDSSPTPQFKSINSLVLSFLYSPISISIHDYWKNHSLTRRTFVGNVMSLLFNMLPRLVVAFFGEFQIQKLNEFSILPVYRRNHLPSVFQICPGLMEVC